MIRAEENPGLACWWLVEWPECSYPLAAVTELLPAFVVELAGLAEEQTVG